MGAMSPRRIKAVTKRFQIFRAIKQTAGDVTVSQLVGITGLPDGHVRQHLKVLNMKAKNARTGVIAEVVNAGAQRPDLVEVMEGRATYENTIHANQES